MNLQTIDKPKTIELGDITIEVNYKNIKNIHLRVYPPTGTVRISAPQYMNPDRIRLFAIDCKLLTPSMPTARYATGRQQALLEQALLQQQGRN